MLYRTGNCTCCVHVVKMALLWNKKKVLTFAPKKNLHDLPETKITRTCCFFFQRSKFITRHTTKRNYKYGVNVEYDTKRCFCPPNRSMRFVNINNFLLKTPTWIPNQSLLTPPPTRPLLTTDRGGGGIEGHHASNGTSHQSFPIHPLLTLISSCCPPFLFPLLFVMCL